MAPRVLFIVNDPIAPAAMLGDAFADLGCDVDTFAVVAAHQVDQPDVEVRFPDPTDYDVVVPLGARWAVYDERLTKSWVAAEMALVRAADAAGVGVLGVCFGGQLIAQAFGGLVQRSADPEIGWYDVDVDVDGNGGAAAPGLIPAGPWFQWHYDRFELPPGAVELAKSSRAIQAFAIGHAVGLQFHPELDGALLEAWLANDGAEAVALGCSLDEMRARTQRLVPDARIRLAALVNGFVTRIRQPRPS